MDRNLQLCTLMLQKICKKLEINAEIELPLRRRESETLS